MWVLDPMPLAFGSIVLILITYIHLLEKKRRESNKASDMVIKSLTRSLKKMGCEVKITYNSRSTAVTVTYPKGTFSQKASSEDERSDNKIAKGGEPHPPL